MKASDPIERVASEAGLARTAARKVVEAGLASIVDAAGKGEEINLPSFGRFGIKDSPATPVIDALPRRPFAMRPPQRKAARI